MKSSMPSLKFTGLFIGWICVQIFMKRFPVEQKCIGLWASVET